MPTAQQPVAPQDLIELGRVAGAYGVRGWLRIHAYSADSCTLLATKYWWFKPPVSDPAAAGGFRCLPIIRAREHGASLVARVKGIDDRTQALTLKGHTVWVPRSQFAPTDPDEVYWADLVGCQAYGEDDVGQSVLLGEVAHVSDNGAHALLHVRRLRQQADGDLVPVLDAKGRELTSLIPFVTAHVHTLDLDNRRLLSNWPADF